MLKNKENKRYLAYLAVGILLIFLYFVGWLYPLERFFQIALNPLAGKFYDWGSGVSQVWSEQANRHDIIQENEELKDRLAASVREEVDYKKLEQENQVLRDFLGFMERNEYDYKMANIISRGEISGEGNYGYYVIDKGSDEGLKIGLAVVDSRGAVVGKVSEVKNNSARVLTVTNKNCKFAASIIGQENTNGLIYGDLGLTTKMSFIPQAVAVAPGDSVVSSGLEEDIPNGLVIGEVIEVNKESNEVWQEAVIEPSADFDNIKIVSVVFKKD